jgi:hypothetical protein
MANAITYGYTAQYNGVNIENASITIAHDFDYGSTGNVLSSMTETVTIKGAVRTENNLIHSRNTLAIASVRNKLTVPAQELRFAMGGTVFTRNNNDDINNGPKPKITEERQVGNEYLEVTLVVVIERQANRFSGFDGIVEITVDYNHDIDERGLSVWTTSGIMRSRFGVCVDAFRNDLVGDFIGEPDGDFIRTQQTYNITKNKTEMNFTVVDTESFYSPAVADVHNAFFKLSCTVTPRSVTRKLDLTIQPTKTAGAINKAKIFAKTVSREVLLQGIPAGVTKLFKDAPANLDSRTGEITYSPSVELIVNISPTEFTMDEVTEYAFFGITTQQALSKFRSGKRDALPRGFSNRSACAVYRPPAGVPTRNTTTPTVDYRPELISEENTDDSGLQKYQDKSGNVEYQQVKQSIQFVRKSYSFRYAYSNDLMANETYKNVVKDVSNLFTTLTETQNEKYIFNDDGTDFMVDVIDGRKYIIFNFNYNAETRGVGTRQDIVDEIERTNSLIENKLKTLGTIATGAI